jgi:hypothetical protein
VTTYHWNPALDRPFELVHPMLLFRILEVFVLFVAMFWDFDLTRAYFASRHKN